MIEAGLALLVVLFAAALLIRYLQSLRMIEAQRVKTLHAARMSSLGEMAGGVAHEINNPLAILSGYAQRSLRAIHADPIPREELAGYLAKIESTIERIAAIVRGLRSFARSSDQDPLMPAELPRLVENSLALCRERFKHAEIQLRIGMVPSVQLVCREPQIVQVITNLLNNAFDAVHGLEERWVEFSVERAAPLRIRITDSGNGILPEISQKMMEPFFTTKAPGKGTGLGLSISKGIIEAHGGTLTLDSGHPHTSFTIELPLVPDAHGGVAN